MDNHVIKNRHTGEIIFSLETENIKSAVEAAVKGNISLGGAYLRGAKGISKYLCTPLLFLLEQPGPIRAYKLVDSNGEGPFNGGIKYNIGETYEVETVNVDEQEQCGEGINLATLDWCMRGWRESYRILIAEFTKDDIAAIPIATDGKFRVKKCRIVGEKDLKKIGLIKEKLTDVSILSEKDENPQ